MFTGRKSSLHSTTLLHSWPGFFHLNLFLSLNPMNPRCALSYHTKTPHWQLWTTIRMKFTFRVVCTRSRVGISATFTELRSGFFFPNVFPSLNPPIIRYALSLCVCMGSTPTDHKMLFSIHVRGLLYRGTITICDIISTLRIMKTTEIILFSSRSILSRHSLSASS